MSLLEECSYEEDGESPLLNSNIKRKQVAANTANNTDVIRNKHFESQ